MFCNTSLDLIDLQIAVGDGPIWNRSSVLAWLLALGFTLSRKLASFIPGYSATSFGAVTLLRFLSHAATLLYNSA
jgi:hypothetical protein